MEPVSAAASIVAIVQMTGQLFDLCQTYYRHVRGARADIRLLSDEVCSLIDVLDSLEAVVNDPLGHRLGTLATLSKSSGPLSSGQNLINGLKIKLEASMPDSSRKSSCLTALRWPLKKIELEKTVKAIDRLKSTFSLALATDNAHVLLLLSNSTVNCN